MGRPGHPGRARTGGRYGAARPVFGAALIHMSKGPTPLDIGSGVWHSLLMPATPLTITVTPEYALVLVPGDDQLFAQVRLDDEEERAVIEFHRHVGGSTPRIVGS